MPYKVSFTSFLNLLLDEITTWTIFYKYLMYKPEAPDENSDCFHIINLENGNSTILVEDFLEGDRECKHLYLITITIDKYLAYNDSVFYVSSSKQMKLFTLVDDVEEGQE